MKVISHHFPNSCVVNLHLGNKKRTVATNCTPNFEDTTFEVLDDERALAFNSSWSWMIRFTFELLMSHAYVLAEFC